MVWEVHDEKSMLFLKNKAGELLKTKDEPKKQTGNKAETKLAKLLKKLETPKKQSENKPENKAGHLAENKESRKNKLETNRKHFELLPGRFEVASLPPVLHSFRPSVQMSEDGSSVQEMTI